MGQLLRSVAFLALATVLMVDFADARGGRGGGGRSHGTRVSHGAKVSHSARAITFRSSACKSSSCFAKHPSGRWVHPITPRK